MTVKYSCGLCGLMKVPVEVPERGDVEDVVHWVGHTVATLLSSDHDQRSPECHPETLTEVDIPMAPGSTDLGRPAKH